MQAGRCRCGRSADRYTLACVSEAPLAFSRQGLTEAKTVLLSADLEAVRASLDTDDIAVLQRHLTLLAFPLGSPGRSPELEHSIGSEEGERHECVSRHKDALYTLVPTELISSFGWTHRSLGGREVRRVHSDQERVEPSTRER